MKNNKFIKVKQSIQFGKHNDPKAKNQETNHQIVPFTILITQQIELTNSWTHQIN